MLILEDFETPLVVAEQYCIGATNEQTGWILHTYNFYLSVVL